MKKRCISCAPIPGHVREAAALVERRWVIATVWACGQGAGRFNEFRSAMPGVSSSTLSERLDQLEGAGVVERKVVDGHPPHAEYRLTEEGRALLQIVDALGAWGGGRV